MYNCNWFNTLALHLYIQIHVFKYIYIEYTDWVMYIRIMLTFFAFISIHSIYIYSIFSLYITFINKIYILFFYTSTMCIERCSTLTYTLIKKIFVFVCVRVCVCVMTILKAFFILFSFDLRWIGSCWRCCFLSFANLLWENENRFLAWQV